MKFFSYYNLVSGTFVRYIIYFSLSFSVAANLKKVIDDPPSSKSMMFPLVSIAVHPCLLFSFMGLQTDKFPFLRSPPPPPASVSILTGFSESTSPCADSPDRDIVGTFETVRTERFECTLTLHYHTDPPKFRRNV